MKQISNDLFSLKTENPEKFWGELSNILIEEYRSEDFLEVLSGYLCDASELFLQWKSDGEKFPFHSRYCVEDERFKFRYFIQIIAQEDAQINFPIPIITGVLPFPGESYYLFNIGDEIPDINRFEIDVFTPHVIDQYARRAYRLESDIDLPNTWHHKRQPAVG